MEIEDFTVVIEIIANGHETVVDDSDYHKKTIKLTKAKTIMNTKFTVGVLDRDALIKRVADSLKAVGFHDTRD